MMEEGFSSFELETIRWMMQKVNLHQDFVDLLDLCIQFDDVMLTIQSYYDSVGWNVILGQNVFLL